jgi:hypothetical protein
MTLAAPSRRSRMRALAALWTALLPACDRHPQQSEQSGPAHEPTVEVKRRGQGRATGSVFDDSDFRLEVRARRVCNETAPFLPEPGQIRISIPVEVRAKTRRLIPTSPLSFQLTDHQGRKYGPTLAGCQPALKNLRLGEGQSIEGDVAFDVDVSARDLELGFQPFLIGRPEVHALVRVPNSPEQRNAGEAEGKGTERLTANED